jgi:hypothetical protein
MTIQDLHEKFVYEPDHGILSYRKNGVAINPQNTAEFEGRYHTAPRIIWALVHGGWPDHNLVVDHINGNISDNRISNLRLVTRSQINSYNSRRDNQTPDPKPEIYALALKYLIDVSKALSSEGDHQIIQLLQPAIDHIRRQVGDLPEAAPPPGITDPLA